MELPDFPLRVELELSSVCNLQCVYCPRQYLPAIGQFMELPLVKTLVDEVAGYSNRILTLHRRGESLLHPDIEAIMGLVSERFAEVQLATNGSALTRGMFQALVDGLTFLSFSLDLPETFNSTRRGADYANVERNILDFLAFNKGRIRTQASMVRVQNTMDEQCERFIAIWKDRVDRVRIYEEHSQNGVFGSLSRERGQRMPCAMPFYELLVFADGSVGRCNHDWNGPRLGDLNRSTIHEVWHSETLRELRRQHKRLSFTDPVCSGCDSWYPQAGVQATGMIVEKQ